MAINKELLKWMLQELLANRLEVVKINYLRRPISVNAYWYREFCKLYETTRKRYPKVRTIIRRQATIKALNRLLLENTSGVYAERLLDFIQDKTHLDLGLF